MSEQDFYNNLQNLGFGMMAAGAQPGATALGAFGQGGLAMNQARATNADIAYKGALTNVQGQDATSKKLSNALALRQLNMGNALYGMPPISIDGIPDLTQQQSPPASQPQPFQAPASPTVGDTSPTATSSAPPSQFRTAPSQMTPENAAKMNDLYPAATSNVSNGGSQPQPSPPSLGGMQSRYSQGAMDVAAGRRAPQTIDEATQAATLLSLSGVNPNRQKELEGLVANEQKPYDLRAGQRHISQLGGGSTLNPEHVQGYNADNVPTVQTWAPPLITNGGGNSSAGNGVASSGGGQGISTGANNNSGGGIRTGFSPQEQKTMDNFYGPEQIAYNNAQGAKYHFAFMKNDLDTLNQNPSFLTTGAGADARMAFAKHANMVTQQMFGVDMYNPDKVAAGESLFKESGRLGFDMSKTLGAREPGVITQMAIKLNPGMDNTPKGAQLITNSLEEAQNRIVDERAFKTQFYEKNGYNQNKAELAFDNQFTPQLYAKRAMSQLEPIKVNNPGAAKQLLAGTKILTPDGRVKIIPQNIGVTPPVYTSSFPPSALPTQPPSQQGDE